MPAERLSGTCGTRNRRNRSAACEYGPFSEVRTVGRDLGRSAAGARRAVTAATVLKARAAIKSASDNVVNLNTAADAALFKTGDFVTVEGSTERAQIQEGANTLADFVAKAPPTDKRVPIVKDALEGVKNAYKVEAEKPAPTRRKKP